MTTTTREFTVGATFNLPKVVATAKKLAERAAAKGLVGGYTVTTRTEQQTDELGVLRQVTKVVITGEPVRYAGWQFVAVAVWENGLPVVTGSPLYQGPQVDRAALVKGWCDHCKTQRNRAKVIVVENEQGARLQVGTSCVKDFLGAEVQPAWYSDKDPFAELSSYGGLGTPLLSLTALLAAAACVVRQAGFRRTSDDRPTVGEAGALMGLYGQRAHQEAIDTYGQPTDEDRATAERAAAYGREMPGDSDYAQNVRAVFASDLVSDNRMGLAVSVVGVMLRAEGQAAERAAAPTLTEALYAEPGTKVTVADAEVTAIHGFETAYGFAEIVVLVGQGYRFKWMTSSSPNLEQGDRVTFTATVKGEDVWNGQTSTKVLRLKVVERATA